MKRTLLLLILISSVGVLFAQNTTFGVKGGLNLANIAGDDVNDTDIKLGFAIGGYVNFPIKEKFSIQPEVYYSSKGCKKEVSSSGGDPNLGYEFSSNSNSTVKFNYLEIPILGVYKILDNLSLFGGPYIEFYLNGEAETDYNMVIKMKDSEGNWVTNREVGSESLDMDSDLFNSPVIGVILGAQYELDKFNFSARYSMGIGNIYDNSRVDAKNRVIQFMVGYRIN